MAGRVQLQTSGPQDAFFTNNPEYTYFIKNFQKHTNFAPFFVDLDVKGEIEFGNTLRCTIPQNQGDLLKTVSLKVELGALEQNVNGGFLGTGYVESIGHAMIEYAELYIGDNLIQRVPSDFLAIYSDNYVTQTKQYNLAKLIGKPPLEFSGTPVSNVQISGYLGYATSNQNFFVDIPFYFYNNPELAVPLCAITNQEVEIVIKLRDVKDCICDHYNGKSYTLYTGLSPTGLIKSLKVSTEMVSINEEERQKIISTKTDYIITQIQESKTSIPQSVLTIKHKLEFKNPVKELFFIIQLENTRTINTPILTPFDYDLDYPLSVTFDEYINYENLRSLELTLDDTIILNEETGSIINLRAVQSGIHHTRTQLFRRYYSYSFALEPERWYPTGQRNFSLVKDQIINLNLNPYNDGKRELRVLGLSYNILRVENGIAKTLFNL